MHNADINNNEFERCGYCAATLWVDNGTIADNTFWDIYPAPDAVPPGTPSYALTLIGTAYRFPIPSNNVNVTDNSFYYNNYADPNKPEYGVRVHTGCDASGAYHPTLNADGQGGQVSDAVDFEPWRCLSWLYQG